MPGGIDGERTAGVTVPGGTTVTGRTAVVDRTAVRGFRWLLVAAALAGVMAWAAAGVARPSLVLGSCAAPPPIDEAVLLGDVVFVGTVLRVENQGRWATVRVEERWSGSRDLPETVAVRGGPEPGTATSVDRTFQPGRYLFVVSGTGGTLQDNACTATQPWTDALATLRPAGVSPAAAELPSDPIGSIDTGAMAIVSALLVALIVAIVAYLYVLRARRRPPDWIR